MMQKPGEFPTPEMYRAKWTEVAPDTEVGKAKRTMFCPLARPFGLTVFLDQWRSGKGQAFPLPAWARTVRARLDDGRKLDEPITAAEALAVLAEVQP